MKARYLLIAALGCLMLGVLGIGQNAGNAQTLAQTVLAQDSAGQDTTSARASLGKYVHAHMGAAVTFVLAASYAKAQAAANATGGDSQLYHTAQAACVSHTTAVNQANCVQSYVASHSTPGSGNVATPSVDKSAFTYNYASPRWTPDLAGLSLLASLLLLIVAAPGLIMRRF